MAGAVVGGRSVDVSSRRLTQGVLSFKKAPRDLSESHVLQIEADDLDEMCGAIRIDSNFENRGIVESSTATFIRPLEIFDGRRTPSEGLPSLASC